MEHNSGTIAPARALDGSSSLHGEYPLIHLDPVKEMIICHPFYHNLTSAFLNCHKVGCPEESIEDLTRNAQVVESKQKASISLNIKHAVHDPELDQFMEGYEKVLVKCKEELERPLLDAREFIQEANSQLNSLTYGSVDPNEKCYMEEEEEEEEDQNHEYEMELPLVDSSLEKQEIKAHLWKKYSGCLSSLRRELSKKKKKNKLPKEARARLLSWWDLHNKWPYPSETEKIELAQSTGLDQKQINNWFINQRKRHWKPSTEMQLNMANIGQSQDVMFTYMGGYFVNDGMYRLGP
ncbi:hypothetical protein LUZ60_006198 [Juncus effusus]|nr:hypothetical protein LUZ60_006198 [Juncus effusus]